jgi:hypothetical protein
MSAREPEPSRTPASPRPPSPPPSRPTEPPRQGMMVRGLRSARQLLSARWLGPLGRFGVTRIRFAGPVFRFGRNPPPGFFLSRKIADVRLRTVACYYGNEPGTAAVQFGLKLRLGHRGLLDFCPPASAARIVRVSQENAGTKKGKQRGD